MHFRDITPEELILKLRSTEHDFVERKSKSDKRGWLQTAVAFANSAPVGWPAVLFVGATDDGKAQFGTGANLEDTVKSISDLLAGAFPAIYSWIVPLHLPEGSCLAVIIPGSEGRPHFAGQSYVRVGAQTKLASERQFAELVAQRSSKLRQLLEWKGKAVTWLARESGIGGDRKREMTLADCNSFYLTLAAPHYQTAIPVSALEVSYDYDAGRPMIESDER